MGSQAAAAAGEEEDPAAAAAAAASGEAGTVSAHTCFRRCRDCASAGHTCEGRAAKAGKGIGAAVEPLLLSACIASRIRCWVHSIPAARSRRERKLQTRCTQLGGRECREGAGEAEADEADAGAAAAGVVALAASACSPVRVASGWSASAPGVVCTVVALISWAG